LSDLDVIFSWIQNGYFPTLISIGLAGFWRAYKQLRAVDKKFEDMLVSVDRLASAYVVLNHNSSAMIKALLKKGIISPDELREASL